MAEAEATIFFIQRRPAAMTYAVGKGKMIVERNSSLME